MAVLVLVLLAAGVAWWGVTVAMGPRYRGRSVSYWRQAAEMAHFNWSKFTSGVQLGPPPDRPVWQRMLHVVDIHRYDIDPVKAYRAMLQGDAGAVPVLRALLQDPDPDTWEDASDGLA